MFPGSSQHTEPIGTLKIASDKTTVLKHIASSQPKWARKGLGRGGKSLGLDWEEVFLKVIDLKIVILCTALSGRPRKPTTIPDHAANRSRPDPARLYLSSNYRILFFLL